MISHNNCIPFKVNGLPHNFVVHFLGCQYYRRMGRILVEWLAPDFVAASSILRGAEKSFFLDIRPSDSTERLPCSESVDVSNSDSSPGTLGLGQICLSMVVQAYKLHRICMVLGCRGGLLPLHALSRQLPVQQYYLLPNLLLLTVITMQYFTYLWN